MNRILESTVKVRELGSSSSSSSTNWGHLPLLLLLSTVATYFLDIVFFRQEISPFGYLMRC